VCFVTVTKSVSLCVFVRRFNSSKYKVKCFRNNSYVKWWISHDTNVIMAQTNGGKSLWMQNFAVRSANGTQRSLYNTWDEWKVMKRLGAMRLKIPINDYDNQSKDIDMIKQRFVTWVKQKVVIFLKRKLVKS
jgi:hypothetical protein